MGGERKKEEDEKQRGIMNGRWGMMLKCGGMCNGLMEHTVGVCVRVLWLFCWAFHQKKICSLVLFFVFVIFYFIFCSFLLFSFLFVFFSINNILCRRKKRWAKIHAGGTAFLERKRWMIFEAHKKESTQYNQPRITTIPSLHVWQMWGMGLFGARNKVSPEVGAMSSKITIFAYM